MFPRWNYPGLTQKERWGIWGINCVWGDLQSQTWGRNTQMLVLPYFITGWAQTLSKDPHTQRTHCTAIASHFTVVFIGRWKYKGIHSVGCHLLHYTKSLLVLSEDPSLDAPIHFVLALRPEIFSGVIVEEFSHTYGDEWLDSSTILPIHSVTIS